MTPEEIKLLVNEAVAAGLAEHLPDAVQTAVDKSINGKVKALTEKVTPIAEAYDKYLSTKRLAATAVGIVISIGGLITAAQAAYAFLSGHLTIK